jgi:hypothetical protein
LKGGEKKKVAPIRISPSSLSPPMNQASSRIPVHQQKVKKQNTPHR